MKSFLFQAFWWKHLLLTFPLNFSIDPSALWKSRRPGHIH